MVASDGCQPAASEPGPTSAPDPSPASSTADFHHLPVMVDEVVELIRSLPRGTFLDATVGGGGHASAVLEANQGLRLFGLDRDPAALEAAARRLEPHGDRVILRRARFDQTEQAMNELPPPGLAGFLFDLGVSSPQLDVADRGFSFRNDGPLDMRMDPDQALSADDVVNRYDQRSLAELIRRYSDERNAPRIAAAIVAARPIETTARLAEVVADAIPAPARRRGGHPARRTFQAIRIEVNDELRILGPAIDRVLDALIPGGRGIVITYHSGEDRIAKDAFRRRTASTTPPGLPVAVDEPDFAIVRPIARKPGASELASNPRASSARLRAIERRAA
ncbi:MAG: 16S rRNA (cytosine(1402)-N(4))-methyltransferase RsmH [Actinomycetota bacterium]